MAHMTLALGEDACLQTVGEYAERMRAAIVDSNSVEIDLTDAKNADLSILQLLESARRHGVSIGCELSLSGPFPPGIRALLDRSGFLAGTGADTSFWHHGDTHQ